MNKEINRIQWKCRRGMREIDLLLREFSRNTINEISDDELSIFEEVLAYDDQSLYDYIFKDDALGNDIHENFIKKYLKTFSNQGNF
tara:strand:- start:12363 stop:12620 length:258 start_codon:yes stop_codon:yes gene_type:complete